MALALLITTAQRCAKNVLILGVSYLEVVVVVVEQMWPNSR